MCKVAIQDDTIFEGPETFFVELSHPEFSLLGRPARAAVTVYDREDGRASIITSVCGLADSPV